jgi:hypothetical protein
MVQPPLQVSMSQVEPPPHLVMPQPPEVQSCNRQLADVPSQLILQAPPQVPMLQDPPALQPSMVQFPLVQVLIAQLGV